MTIHGLHSKASIKGHPIHPMLVGFPIALYTTGLITLVVFAVLRDPFWYRAAITLWFAGVGMAGLAAIFGIIDLFLGIPRSELATRKTGYMHFGLNLLALILFTAAAFMLLDSWTASYDYITQMPFTTPLVLGGIGLILTAAAGALGWKLVQTHHVGIESDMPRTA
jgi:uncharacterized membrane protein